MRASKDLRTWEKKHRPKLMTILGKVEDWNVDYIVPVGRKSAKLFRTLGKMEDELFPRVFYKEYFRFLDVSLKGKKVATRSPVKSMMTPFFSPPLTKSARRRISDSYRSVIRLGGRSKPNADTFGEKLEKMGKEIGEILQPVFDHFGLFSRRDIVDLALTLDKCTVQIPWELAILDRKPRGFLCEEMNIGRTIDIESKTGFYDAFESKAHRRTHRPWS